MVGGKRRTTLFGICGARSHKNDGATHEKPKNIKFTKTPTPFEVLPKLKEMS